MIKDKVVAMLLAGGQGSRLKNLTKKIAKPAVPFGGKYRIIDFALSNATNSGINDIGILTQYKPFMLNAHIGVGKSWDLDRRIGGLSILPPYTSETGGRWYTATANAIYENMDFIDNLDPEFVLILSGDHIYKMDYNRLLDIHKEKNSDVTAGVVKVPWDEASRFGIVNVDENNKIVEFDEKPEKPKNNMANMGIYMFNWESLRKYLMEDHQNENSDHDFGKNILPKMLKDGKDMYTWVFEDYWKDVGTIDSYHQANMDLLDDKNTLNLYDRDWRIYTDNKNLPPQFISKDAKVKNSLVNEACEICGELTNSVLFSDVTIEKGAKVNNSVILSQCIIREGAEVNNAVVLEGMVVSKDTKVGSEDSDDLYLVCEEGIIKQ